MTQSPAPPTETTGSKSQTSPTSTFHSFFHARKRIFGEFAIWFILTMVLAGAPLLVRFLSIKNVRQMGEGQLWTGDECIVACGIIAIAMLIEIATKKEYVRKGLVIVSSILFVLSGVFAILCMHSSYKFQFERSFFVKKGVVADSIFDEKVEDSARVREYLVAPPALQLLLVERDSASDMQHKCIWLAAGLMVAGSFIKFGMIRREKEAERLEQTEV